MNLLTSTKNGNAKVVEKTLDGYDVRRIMPQRNPVLLLDQARLYVGGKRLVGVKVVPQNEPFLDGHFPEYPIYPGIWILEALKQTCECLLRLTDPVPGRDADVRYFLSESWIKHLRPVHPGETIDLEAVLTARDGDRATLNITATVATEPAGKGRLVLTRMPAQPVASRGMASPM